MPVTCDVPQLEAHRLLVPVEHLEREVHADRGAVVGAEVVMDVALDDAGLPHAQVSYDEDLIKMFLVVVVLVLVIVLHGDRRGRGLRINVS